MKYRRFGATELMVSEIGFGCARLGGIFGQATKADMVRTLRRAFDEGVTFFDTADMYCQGESESLLGEAFRPNRTDVIIASKAGYCLPRQRRWVARAKPLVRPILRRVGIRRDHLPPAIRGELSQDFSPGYLSTAVEASLRRLRTDYLDLFQLHSPPPEVLERGEFVEALEKMKRQGKIRYSGVSCESPDDVRLCLRLPGISALQVRLSLLDQRAAGGDVERCAQAGVGLVARECLAGGLLAKPGEYLQPKERLADEEGTAATRRRQLIAYQQLARRHERSLSELAVQFVLAQAQISVALLGMRTEEHLGANLACMAAAPLNDDENGELIGIRGDS